ncbi:MAG: leader peptidase (prepilin peptidase) / N-methyltransferase [Frankiales bacterium]|jgi:leader peptidase (prepilin peptidase)/N-methyltransferase|nr:leader peptidase (prepilin peptidase) / N-methyltransferase [Frankiales bacterium]
MTSGIAALVGVLGLMVGSFLNVVIWRVPRGESVVRPESHCPGCNKPIRPRDNVPVLSWLLLRGRCRDCGTSISPRYPAVEVLTALVWAAFGLKFGYDAQLPAYLYLGAVGVALALIDIDTKRLPNALVLPSYPIAMALLAIAAGVNGQWGDFVRALLGMAALYGFYFALVLAVPRGMGFGDVKLAGVLGLYLGWLGWGQVIAGGFLGFLVGSVAGIGLMVARRAGRKTEIPFGPFMLLGAFLAVFWGHALANAYTSTFT